MIFNSGTVRNPGTSAETIIMNNGPGSGLNNTFGFNPFGSPGYSDFPGQAMLSNIDTFAKNFRWYFISNFRQIVSEAYVEYGLIRTIVDVPVEDGYRGGITIKTDELDEKDLQILEKSMKLKRDLKEAQRAQKWGRLFGGGGVIILVEDQDPAEPLDLSQINDQSKVEFRAVDLWELFWNLQNTDGYDPSLQTPDFDFYNYYGEKLHKSRVLRTMGLEIPSFVRPRFRGWGASVIETLIRSINQYLKGTDLAFEVLDEFKLDVYKINGFLQALSTTEGEKLATARIRYANGRKNYQHATILDKDDDFEQRQLSFAGLGEVMEGIRLQVASDLRMPLTKIFGISAAGFSTGQEDLENYNMMVESTVRDEAETLVLKMAEVRCQELFGFIPDDLEVSFKPLRVLGGVDEQAIKTQKAQVLETARAANNIGPKEYRDSMNASKAMDVKLDTSDAVINELESMKQEQLDQETELGDDKEKKAGEKEKVSAKSKGGAPKGQAKPAPEAKPAKVANALKRGLAWILNTDKQPEIVTVGVLNRNQILTGRRRDNGLWVSPGGHMDPGESPARAAVREVMEESGIELQESDLQKISTETITSPRTGKDFILHCYLANIDNESPTTKNDPDQEIEEWRWVNLDPKTPELQPEARHAKNDSILKHLFEAK